MAQAITNALPNQPFSYCKEKHSQRPSFIVKAQDGTIYWMEIEEGFGKLIIANREVIFQGTNTWMYVPKNTILEK